jgi:hypothetical protein
MKQKVATLNSPVVGDMPSGAEVQQARDFLRGHTFNRGGSEIPPRRFAAAQKETKAKPEDLLAVIARSYAGGQGQDAERQSEVHSIAAGGGE